MIMMNTFLALIVEIRVEYVKSNVNDRHIAINSEEEKKTVVVFSRNDMNTFIIGIEFCDLVVCQPVRSTAAN